MHISIPSSCECWVCISLYPHHVVCVHIPIPSSCGMCAYPYTLIMWYVCISLYPHHVVCVHIPIPSSCGMCAYPYTLIMWYVCISLYPHHVVCVHIPSSCGMCAYPYTLSRLCFPKMLFWQVPRILISQPKILAKSPILFKYMTIS